MDGASARFTGSGFWTAHAARRFFDLGGLRNHSRRFEPQVLEQHLLLSGQEAQLEPAEDVVHDRLGVADVGIAGPSARFKASVREFLAEKFQRDAVLQRDRDGQREAVHQIR